VCTLEFAPSFSLSLTSPTGGHSWVGLWFKGMVFEGGQCITTTGHITIQKTDPVPTKCMESIVWKCNNEVERLSKALVCCLP